MVTNEVINVAYSSSDEYSWLLGVSLFSLLENNKQEKLHIFVISNGICESKQTILRSMVSSYGQMMTFLPRRNLGFEQYFNQKDRWGFSCLQKISLLTDPMPCVDRLLYLDSDTIINGSIRDLYFADLHGALVGGVLDPVNKRQRDNLRMSPGNPYFNAGVLLLNVGLARSLNLAARYLAFLKSTNFVLRFQDQDLMNGALSEKEKCVLPLEYNLGGAVANLTYSQLEKLRQPFVFYTKEDYDKAKKNPILIHYSSFFMETSRVWEIGGKSPFKDIFYMYKNKSPFSSVLAQKNHNSRLKKMAFFFIGILPRWLTIMLVSPIYNYWIPTAVAHQIKKASKNRVSL